MSGTEIVLINTMWDLFGIDIDKSIMTMPRPESFI